jgi:hypothetical protein
MKKREFVVGGCTTIASGIALSAPAAPDVQPAMVRSVRRLARFPDLASSAGLGAWQQYVGERFVQPVSGGDVAMDLRRIVDQGGAGQGEQFTLVFASPADAQVPAGTRLLRHGSTGQRVAVFLQAAGMDSDGATLHRAHFNRLA